jgi:hypothetical protein
MTEEGPTSDQTGAEQKCRSKLNEYLPRKKLIVLANVLLIVGLLFANYGLTYYSDLTPRVARTLALIFFSLLMYFGSKIFSTSKNSSVLGYGGILTLLIIQSLILWRGTESHLLR